ncbi:thioester reductase domain-containing protein [Streptomyces zagrosensis]|uniref:Nonribosomal peptide synthetase MxcG n=1 Tax=Streptomyces zagrosensis TaxID=1042984 RepID=A0A7W9UW29_9ACTN|nr:thioester reductase domain-containing protein [Streptomyces zagrosensis]MBB5933363.1 nonribosomal peptide synthetase MxcG [Streptomyces zagrosensis]
MPKPDGTKQTKSPERTASDGPAGQQVPAGEHHPLLAAQEGIWTGQQLDRESPAFNTAEYVCIAGSVDTAAFERALHQVIAETEALNVRFTVIDGRPRQVTTPATDWRPHIADLTPEAAPRAAALAWMARDMARPVDLEREPVFEHALFRVGTHEHWWYHRVHHIALDGFGLSLVARRIADVYTALASDQAAGDSGFGTFQSVRDEEHAYQNSPRREKDRAYWTQRYADRPAVPSLTSNSGLPARDFLRQVTDLAADEVGALRKVAAELSVTWSDVLLASTACYIQQVSGAAEAVLSVPVMGRLGSVSLRVPCMVRNVLPLRVPIGDRDSLADLAPRVAAELRAGLPHQRYRYEHLRRDLKLIGGKKRLSGPGVNIMPFEYDLRFAGHPSTVHNVSAGPVDDLSVNVYDRAEGAGLRFAFDANPELYSVSDLAGHQRGLLALLRAALAEPHRPLSEVAGPAGGSAAATSVVTGGAAVAGAGRSAPGSAAGAAGGTAALPVIDGGPLRESVRPVLDRIAERAATQGAATAVEHGEQRMSYTELTTAARRVANLLTARGLGPGSLVAIALPRGIDAVTAILGTLYAGAAYCPLDPGAPTSRTTALLAAAEAGAVLTTAAYAAKLPGAESGGTSEAEGAGRAKEKSGPGERAVPLPGGARAVPVVLLDATARTEATAKAEADADADAVFGADPVADGKVAPPAVAPDDLAYVIYTSGSTGAPKGVEISHGALAHFVTGATERYELGAQDRVLQFAPLHFDASVEEIFLTLCAGATLVVRTDEMTESVPTLTGACERLRISVLDLPTAYWHEMAYALSTGAATLPAAVRTVIIGGEAAVPERVDRWRRAVGTSVRLFNTYGPTEATVVATVADLHAPELAPGDVPIGRPLPGTRAVLVPVADGPGTDAGGPGTVGELHLVGDALARGYRGAHTADAARFAPLAALDGAPRAYRTGDLVRLAGDGLLRFIGRVDGEFKISGHRVHPTEVETALLRHPGIREAAVVGQILPDGTRRLVAHLVADGTAPEATAVREGLRAVLPAAMIPSALTFHERLPLTSSGKIDRNALTALDAPATGRGADEAAAQPGGNPLERAIAGVWEQILGTEHIAPQDDFFDLGAQSLQAIQVANRLGVELAREVKVAWLFQYPTAGELAAFLDERAGGGPAQGAAATSGAAAQGPASEELAAADATAGIPAGLPAAVAAVARDAVLAADIVPGTRSGVAPTTDAESAGGAANKSTGPAGSADTRRPVPVDRAAPPRQVLLTGATGFVGAHLLAELLASTDAEVVCLVRAADREQAAARLRQALDDQQLTVGEAARRIVAEPADLGKPHLGLAPARLAELSASCDAVFHNAATVSIMREYSSLRGANTESTRELLRLAAPRSVPFHLISTLSTAPPYSHSPEVPEAFFPPHAGLIYGYQQSKWASERLLEQAAERGLPVTLHRLGRIVGAPDTGYVNERDFVWSVLRAGIPAGIVPDLFEAEVWTPVDYVARAVVRLALSGGPDADVVYNHAPAPQLRLNDLYAWVRAYGYPVRQLPLGQWRTELPRAADVATTTLAFFDTFGGAEEASGADKGGAVATGGKLETVSEEGPGKSGAATDEANGAAEPELGLGEIRADNVLRGLAGTGISCPAIDRSLVFRYLDHCVKTGILPRPTGDDRPEPVAAG